MTTMGCASILYNDKNGFVIHGHNFDEGFGSWFDNLSAEGHFYRDGQLVYRSNVAAGYVGCEAGMTQNISISQLSRNNNTLQENINTIMNSQSYNVQYLTTMLLRTPNISYEQAKNALSNWPIDAASFYAVSGVNKNEGAIITRNFNTLDNIAELNDTNPWFLVQTNYDRVNARIVPPLSYNGNLFNRRIPAEKKLESIGQLDMTKKQLFDDILTVYPDRNNGTQQTYIMDTQQNYFNLTFWLGNANSTQL